MLLAVFYIFLVILFGFLLKFSFWRHTYSHLLPGKKPRFFDILADAREVVFFRNSDSRYSIQLKFVDILRNANTLFQKDHLFCLWVTFLPFVFLVKADAVKEALNGNKLREKSWPYEFMKPVFGSGLATSPHATWKPRRKQLNRCFHPNILRSFLPIFNENAYKLVQFFSQYETKFVEISHPVALCALDIICETVFDVKLQNLGNDESQYAKSVRRGSELVFQRAIHFWLWPDIIFWNAPCGREGKFHIKVVKDFTEKVIREKKAQHFSISQESDKGKRLTLIDVLLQLHLVDGELTEEDVRNEVNTFALGGHDTAAVTVSWALYLIGLYPNIQAKIHQELDTIFGEDTNREITEDDLNRLHYLDCVIKETHRLYPPVPMFGRKVEEETTICGHTIPKNASCFVLTYFLHRDEDVFSDPEEFNPDRFLPENSIKIPEFAYIPFSAGPRSCIGYRYATMEVKILVATVLRSFTIESMEERKKVLPVMQIALHSSSPIYVRFKKRALSTT